VFLSFFYDVFLENLPLKTPQCVFNGFSVVYLNMRHLIFFTLGSFSVRARSTAHDSEARTSPSITSIKLLVWNLYRS
jgi:hypothetical protein